MHIGINVMNEIRTHDTSVRENEDNSDRTATVIGASLLQTFSRST
jgi:hypothetical protein